LRSSTYSGDGTASIDAQYAVNPAYNRDRGPVWIGSLGAHIEISRKAFSK
jgi:hypothetical protein